MEKTSDVFAPLLLAVVLLPLPLRGAAQSRPQLGCNEPVHRQFDFWIGDWTVTNPAGQTIGKNSIRSIQGGCALEEKWTGGAGGTGISLNFVERGKWNQVWVANHATGILRLTGSLEQGAMVMAG